MRIFILEDDPMRMGAFREAFIGHDIIHAKSVTEGYREWYKDPKFDIVLLDHDLADFNNLDASEWMKANAENNGMTFVRFICDPIPFEQVQDALFVVHSWNPDGADLMTEFLIRMGRFKNVSRCPFGPEMIKAVQEWINVQMAKAKA